MLSMASDEYANKGCNDLHPSDLEVVTDEDKLCAEIREWSGEDDFPQKIGQIGDDFLMHFLSDQLIEMENTLPYSSLPPYRRGYRRIRNGKKRYNLRAPHDCQGSKMDERQTNQ